MNIPRLLALADLIEAQPHAALDTGEDGFNMNEFEHDCGTPSCIAGWAAWEQRERVVYDINFSNSEIISSACKWLSLDNTNETEHLFFPNRQLDFRVDYEDITPSQAATVLRHLAATGKIDWSIINV